MCEEHVEILLVEDNPQDEEMALRALKKAKVANEVRVVRDGAEALDYLFAQGAYADRNVNHVPRLILLDLKLPKVSGLEVLEKVKAHGELRRVPVVVLTSSAEEQDLIESYRLGVNSFITKPVDFDQFVKCVGDLSYYWLLVNKPPK